MDIAAIASLATQLSQQRTAQTAELLVLKKAMQLQASTARTLIESVQPRSELPPHLGRNINVVA
ncbi:MAG TPA: YjfB family protein [Polyangiales bacterium]|nr:YjfB family protein [Polyangiales bacterium]